MCSVGSGDGSRWVLWVWLSWGGQTDLSGQLLGGGGFCRGPGVQGSRVGWWIRWAGSLGARHVARMVDGWVNPAGQLLKWVRVTGAILENGE